MKQGLIKEGDALIPCELRAALMQAEGYKIAKIADLTGLTVQTVREYLKRARKKTGTHNAAQLAKALKSAARL